MFPDNYPYTNFHELNLGYFIIHFREIFSQWADLYDQMLSWKDATDEELATWKTGVETDLTARETALRAELNEWKTQTGQDIAGWESATLAALTAWQTATQAVFEQIRTEAAASATAAAGSATAAETAKTAAQTAQAAAETAAASITASAAQIAENTGDIAILEAQTSLLADAVGSTEVEVLGNYTAEYYWNDTENPVTFTAGGSSYRGYDAIPITPGDEYHVYVNSGGSPNQHPVVIVDADYNVLMRSERHSNTFVTFHFFAPATAAYMLITTYSTAASVTAQFTAKHIIYNSLPDLSDDLDARLDDDETAISILQTTKENKESVVMRWNVYGTASHPTGFRGGYIDSTGVSQTSNFYLKSVLITAAQLSQFSHIHAAPPEGYFIWASVFVNDAVGSANFQRQYGDYANRVPDPIDIILNTGESMIISIGRFADSGAPSHNTDEFLAGIVATAYYKEKNGACRFYGKRLSIMGDSISAFSDDIPEGNRSYYPAAGVTTRDQMWYNIVAEKLTMIPDLINGWSGSCVTFGIRNDTTYLPASSDSRCANLGTSPDIILVAMGVNDYTYMGSADKFGTWDGSTSLGVSIDVYDVSTFKTAYASMIAKIRYNYPNAELFCITPWFTERHDSDTGVTFLNDIGKQEYEYSEAVKDICLVMNCEYLEGTNIGFNRDNFYPTYAQDSATIPTHPNPAGHAHMADSIIRQLLSRAII